MSKRDKAQKSSQQNNPTNKQEADLDLIALTQLQLFCGWVPPLIEKSLGKLAALKAHPTRDYYEVEGLTIKRIFEDTASLIEQLRSIEDALLQTDEQGTGCQAHQKDLVALAAKTTKLLEDIFQTTESILKNCIADESCTEEQMTIAEVSNDSLEEDTRSPRSRLFLLPPERARALATMRIFTSNSPGDDTFTIVDLLAGCSFLPYNIVKAQEGDGDSQTQDGDADSSLSECLDMKPELAAAALNALFLSAREAQSELFNYCFQSLLAENTTKNYAQLFLDLIEILGNPQSELKGFNEDKVAALRSIALKRSPIQAYEDFGTIVVSFLLPHEVEPLLTTVHAVLDLIIDQTRDVFTELKLNPQPFIQADEEMLEIGFKVNLPCRGDQTEIQKNSADILEVYSNENYLELTAAPPSQVSFEINLEDNTQRGSCLNFLIDNSFLADAGEANSDKGYIMAGALKLAANIPSSALVRVHGLPPLEDDGLDLDDVNGNTNFGDNDYRNDEFFGDALLSVVELPQESDVQDPISALEQRYKLWSADGWDANKWRTLGDFNASVSSPALTIPISSFLEREMLPELIKVAKIVDISELPVDLISNYCNESEENEACNQFAKQLAELIVDRTDSLTDEQLAGGNRLKLCAPIDATYLSESRQFRFYLSNGKNELCGFGAVPIQGDGTPYLRVFSPNMTAKFSALTNTLIESIDEARNTPGRWDFLVHQRLIERNFALSKEILDDLNEKFEHTLTLPSASEVRTSLYTNIAALAGSHLQVSESFKLATMQDPFSLTILTKSELDTWRR